MRVSIHVSSSFHQLCSVLPDIENLHSKLCVCINEYLQPRTHTPYVCEYVCALYLWLCILVSVCLIHTLVRQGTLISSLSSLDPFQIPSLLQAKQYHKHTHTDPPDFINVDWPSRTPFLPCSHTHTLTNTLLPLLP